MSLRAVFLRGINVGGYNKVPMQALRSAVSDAGFGNVQTYIQSGNIVLDSNLAPDAVSKRVVDILHTRFQVDVAVLSLTKQQLDTLVRSLPETADPTRVYVHMYLAPTMDQMNTNQLQIYASPSETLLPMDDALILIAPDGIGRSKLAARISRQLNVTARNQRTLIKMRDMMADPQ